VALPRRVEPEILDELPGDDPRAVRSRGDLRRINALMFHSRIMAGMLRRHLARPPRRILEIGAGDGAFSLAVARRLAAKWPEVDLILLDQQEIVPAERRKAFSDLGWRVETVKADVFAWLGRSDVPSFDAVTANLFLHHFEPPALRELFEAAARSAPAFVATEPWRTRLPLALSRMLWAIGANDVTRHDATASVRAGFAGHELGSLWPDEPGWRIEERRVGIFTHAFAASKT
jgi:SAM-dependent methyltransferase